MSLILTDNQNYKDIASAIRNKNKSEISYKPSEMAEAINNISSIDKTNSAPIESGILTSGTGTGLVSLDNTVEWGLKDLKIYGKSSQFTTTGAQLFDAKTCLASQIEAGIVSINIDGSLTLNGTFGTMNRSFYVTLPAGTYYFNDPEKIFHVLSPSDSLWTHAVILEEETELFCYVTSETYSNKIVKPMINVGSTALSWEPYAGGQPSPNHEYPQEIQNAGDDGEVDVTIRRGNFMPLPVESKTLVYNGITLAYDAETEVFSFSGTATDYSWFSLYSVINAPSTNKDDGVPVGDKGLYLVVDVPLPTGVQMSCSPSPNTPIVAGGTHCTLQAPVQRVYMLINPGVSISYAFRIGIFGAPDAEWEPYSAESQQLVVPTPDGLPGIPVSSGGNWTDENGQVWVSDVIDMASQEKTQWNYKVNPQDLKARTINGAFVVIATNLPTPDVSYSKALCNIASEYSASWDNLSDHYFLQTVGQQVVIAGQGWSSEADAQAAIDAGIEFIYPTATPITSPIDDATIAAYRALQSYPGTTNVLAPDCGIEASVYEDATDYQGALDREDSLVDGSISNYINKSTKIIRAYAFYGVTSLINIYFKSVTQILQNCFQNCTNLKIAVFDSLTSINGQAFQDDTKLQYLVIKSNSICKLNATNSFVNTPIASGTGYIYVPDDLVDQYKTATNWVTYASQIKPLSEIPPEIQEWLDEQQTN